ncbi:MAG: site-specific integrase, partial [Endomicrobium sp.]|nr:site-specific integrase [Endomicrobium sp.]
MGAATELMVVDGVGSKVEIAEKAEIKEEWFSRFISYLDASPTTVKAYKYELIHFAKYLTDTQKPTPTREDIIGYREYLKTKYKPATTIFRLGVVKLFFRWLASENLYKNIADHIKGVRTDKGHKRDYLTSVQVKSVLDKIDRSTVIGKRNYAIIALSATCGLRTIELARANVEDLRNIGDMEVLY